MREGLRPFYGLFKITAIVTHVWTIIIAYEESGLLAAIISFFLPFLSEIYWLIQMFDVNKTYATIVILHLVLAVFYPYKKRRE